MIRRGIGVGSFVAAGGGAAPYVGLLDTYTGAAVAYSVRLLRTAYTGNAIRVRRSSDNTEQDIGFDISGNLNESALTTFVGAGNGFVTTWYDQSGNGRNATQSTAANQPRIVNAGTIEKQNNKPAIFANSAINSLISSTNSGGGNGINFLWSFIPFNMTQLNLVNYYAFEVGTGKGIYAGGSFSGITGFTAGNVVSTNETTNIFKLGTAKVGSSNSQLWINGISVATYAPSNNFTFMRILGGINTDHGSLSYVPEMIFYNSDQTSNRTGIESNINTYYGIY